MTVTRHKKTVTACVATLLLGLAGPAGAATDAASCPPFEMPPDVQAHWVAQDMKMNGIPMQIKELDASQPPEAIIAFYKRAWGVAPPYYYEYNIENTDWQVIATLKKKICFYTVQLHGDGKGGTNGLLGVSVKPDGDLKKPGAGFPVLAGSRVLNDMDSNDGGKTGRTVIVRNNHSAEDNAAFYRSTLGNDGWNVIVDRAVPGGAGDGYVLVMKRGREETNLAISSGKDGTSVLATWVDRP